MAKRHVHAAFVAAAGRMVRLLPERVPLTFAGTDSLAELCTAIGHEGEEKVLVVTDEVLVDLGIAAKVTDLLEAAGVASEVYSGVTPDPTFAQVAEGLAAYRKAGCTGVVAVGGGSPMDAAKVIAAAATNGGQPNKLVGKFKVRQAPAPLYAVPTTAGTGSEVTGAAVVSEVDTHTKRFVLDPKLTPRMVALDPTLMLGVPPAVTAATGMDALTHAVESYIAQSATPATKATARRAARLIFQNLPTAVANGSDVEARKAMAMAAYYAGMAFTRTSVGYVHALAHNLGATYGTPHGLANAVCLPHVLAASKAQATPQLAELGRAIGLDGSDDAQVADAFIDAVRALMAEIDIPPTLDALQPGDIADIAQRAHDEAFLEYPAPRYLEPEDCADVLRKLVTPAA